MTDDISEPRESLRTDGPLGPGELTMRSEREGDVHTIALFGELDLSGLTFMDSTGVRLLVNANTRARTDDCRLTLVRGPAAVQRVMELSGVDELLPFAD